MNADESKRKAARLRSRLLRETADFFVSHGHLEVDTPLVSPHLIPESTIDVFTTRFRDRELYLIPSPEVWMKRLLTEGWGSIFQICRCFRNNESLGIQHNPEFTMLEWYTLGSDYRDSLGLTRELLSRLAAGFDSPVLEKDPLEFTMAEAFARYAGFDLEKNIGLDSLVRRGRELGLSFLSPSTSPGAGWEEVFNRIFLTFVEPELPTDRPVFITDYPAGIPCLAKGIPGTPWAERWELYIRGMEIANCFSEETDRENIDAFFRGEVANFPESGKHRIDWSYPELLSRLPECSGTALGVDRLLMVLAGAGSIEEVLLFPYRR
ncbi:MAG: amino acid--tRNA ligase-related protein [Spirochaetia bacterium]